MEAILKGLDQDAEQIQERIDQRQADQNGSLPVDQSGNRKAPNESQRDFLIRTGKITPFSKLPTRSLTRSDSTLQGVLFDEEDGGSDSDSNNFENFQVQEPLSHRNLVQPGFIIDSDVDTSPEHTEHPRRPAKKRRLISKSDDIGNLGESEENLKDQVSSDNEDSAYNPGSRDSESSPSIKKVEDVKEGGESISSSDASTNLPKSRIKRARASSMIEDLRGLDDGNEKLYQDRLRAWVGRRRAARAKERARNCASDGLVNSGDVKEDDTAAVLIPNSSETTQHVDDEWHLQHPSSADGMFEGGYKVPGDVFPSLFDYQKTAVQWLWELYSQQVGGIIGDEMGLGKTIQVIAFLAGLHYSKMIKKPVIVVAPATVMKQWVNEFHTWWPPFRVSILHSSGTGMIDLGREAQDEDDFMMQTPSSYHSRPVTKARKAAKKIVDRVVQDGHILITSYSGLQTYAELLVPINWEYAVLDEGHKIRNPNTAITIYCKEIRTANRIILSGTPMQNNLVELWSLFDFVFPMRLGTLVNFRQQFEFPIRQGGYANASNLAVQTAMKCAETLKDTISPYLLQRFKVDVAADLPKKSEQVLFCKLTKLQRTAYEAFLASDDLRSIMKGKRQVLYGVDILRKICNHPDLPKHKTLSINPDYNYGAGSKSGKMQVVKALLELWKEQGHKTLLFAQHRIMLDILEKFVNSYQGFNVRRMDGNTPIQHRQSMVDEFNSNPDAHVFLLTTKVGGLGINLTGANRVIIYDPDWNPSTDVQARERAWRLGQKREVMIYRLMTAGTIEEKVYHRQIFKQFLTNKILRDPKQRQTFQLKDLHDLFTLGQADDNATETSQLFKGTEVQFRSADTAPSLASIPQESLSNEGADPSNNGIANSASSISGFAGISSIEPFANGEEGHKATANESFNSEDRVMQGIFARSGVHSALEHDRIVNGKKIITADPKVIDKEARKVAGEAARELRKAAELAKSVPIGTPTWTGEFGTAGKPDQEKSQRGFGRSRGGPASSVILAGLQSRQSTTDLQAAPASSGTPKKDFRNAVYSGPKGVDFMRMIRDFLITHGGHAYTQMLVDHFNRYCPTPERTAEFREMLKEMATLQKGGRGRGRWTLKEEYQTGV